MNTVQVLRCQCVFDLDTCQNLSLRTSRERFFYSDDPMRKHVFNIFLSNVQLLSAYLISDSEGKVSTPGWKDINNLKVFFCD